MRTRQPEGHSPSPTFRAAFLSLKRCDDHPGNLALYSSTQMNKTLCS